MQTYQPPSQTTFGGLVPQPSACGTWKVATLVGRQLPILSGAQNFRYIFFTRRGREGSKIRSVGAESEDVNDQHLVNDWAVFQMCSSLILGQCARQASKDE
jgi:hypothetical protein